MQPPPNQWIANVNSQVAPFPALSGGQLAAYERLSALYNNGVAIRDAYDTLLTADLLELQQAIQAVALVDGDGYTAADLQAVRDMLAGPQTSEIGCAAEAANFFATLDANFYIGLFALEGFTSEELTSALELTDSPSDNNATLLIANVVLGVAEALISAIPGVGEAGVGVGSMIAGLIATTVQGVEAGITWSNPQPPPAMACAINAYFGNVAASILALSLNLGDIQAQVAGDWGMLQWVAQQTQPGGSLDLTGLNVATATNAANTAFLISGLQTLLPVNFSIFQCYASAKVGSGEPVEYAYWNGFSDDQSVLSTASASALPFDANTPLLYTPSTTATDRGLNFPWAVWWIATQNNATGFLAAPSIFSSLNGLAALFLGQDGWALPITGYNYANIVMFRIANQTSQTLQLYNLRQQPGVLQSPGSSIAPYSSATFALAYDTTLNTVGEIFFEGELKGDAPTGFVNCGFVVSMPQAIVDGQQVTLTPTNWSTADFTVSAQTVPGTFKGACGGGALLVIAPSPSA